MEDLEDVSILNYVIIYIKKFTKLLYQPDRALQQVQLLYQPDAALQQVR
jgi:hypothetical protein